MDEQQIKINEAWSRLGLSPEAFPGFDNSKPAQFQNSAGDFVATSGSQVKITYSLDNFPRMALGLRVRNVWELPDDPSDEEVRLAEYVSRYIDDQQTIEVTMTQNNVTLRNPGLQAIMQGAAGGYVWHNWPAALPLAGGNDLSVTITRVTNYPMLRDTRINPKVYVSLVEIILRADRLTVAPMRMKNV